jgi:hypothetical protein
LMNRIPIAARAHECAAKIEENVTNGRCVHGYGYTPAGVLRKGEFSGILCRGKERRKRAQDDEDEPAVIDHDDKH